ncbi:hypothetical protein NL676_038752 [Syzygium grande]|nr:hypothetical protein NL676_038752 [Syzygium grande]
MNLDMPPVFLLSHRPDRTKNPHHRLQATRTTPNDEYSKATVTTQQHGASETQGLAGIASTFMVQVPSQMVA